jgi:dienelactone hydrolase
MSAVDSVGCRLKSWNYRVCTIHKLEALMAEVLLFHHAQGLTPGVHAFADELRAAGHTVHTPDLFDGRTFGSIDEGMAYIKGNGMEEMVEKGERSADDLPNELVYAASHSAR